MRVSLQRQLAMYPSGITQNQVTFIGISGQTGVGDTSSGFFGGFANFGTVDAGFVSGSSSIHITLQTPVTAFGVNLFTAQQGLTDTVTNPTNASVPTFTSPTLAFFGLTSDTPFSTVDIQTPTVSYNYAFFDNFQFGAAQVQSDPGRSTGSRHISADRQRTARDSLSSGVGCGNLAAKGVPKASSVFGSWLLIRRWPLPNTEEPKHRGKDLSFTHRSSASNHRPRIRPSVRLRPRCVRGSSAGSLPNGEISTDTVRPFYSCFHMPAMWPFIQQYRRDPALQSIDALPELRIQ